MRNLPTLTVGGCHGQHEHAPASSNHFYILRPNAKVMEEVMERFYVGSMYDLTPPADEPIEGEEFVHVLSLSDHTTPHTTEHYPLQNFEEADDKFHRAVDSARKHVQDGELTFVHCTAGVSRSMAVTAATLAVEKGITIDEAVSELKEQREDAALHPNMREAAEAYVEEHTTHDQIEEENERSDADTDDINPDGEFDFDTDDGEGHEEPTGVEEGTNDPLHDDSDTASVENDSEESDRGAASPDESESATEQEPSNKSESTGETEGKDWEQVVENESSSESGEEGLVARLKQMFK